MTSASAAFRNASMASFTSCGTSDGRPGKGVDDAEDEAPPRPSVGNSTRRKSSI